MAIQKVPGEIGKRRSLLTMSSGAQLYCDLAASEIVGQLQEKGWLKVTEYESLNIWALRRFFLRDIKVIIPLKEKARRSRGRARKPTNAAKEAEKYRQKIIKETNSIELGKIIRQMRNEQKLTIKQVMKALKVDRSTIYGYESGDRRVPGKRLLQLAKLFKTNPDEIIKAAEFKTEKKSQATA